jgi:S-adenosylmethionine hydrolase
VTASAGPTTRPPLIALLTDFGEQDHYVGALKGAILTVCPEANVVDVVHELPPHDVLGGAFALAASYAFFPRGTTFVAVVDPGVGSERRALAVAAAGYTFVGPDNGLLTLVLDRNAQAEVRAVTNQDLFRSEVSATFHARDVFGPVAAALAAGAPLASVGPPVRDPVRLHIPPVRAVGAGEWEAAILHVDRFGNLITTLDRPALDRMLDEVDADPTELVVVVEGEVMPLATTYTDVAEGEACALIGSSGYLEIAVHRGSAARLLGASRGAAVRVRKALRSR